MSQKKGFYLCRRGQCSPVCLPARVGCSRASCSHQKALKKKKLPKGPQKKNCQKALKEKKLPSTGLAQSMEATAV